jgi:hypothetical protein
VQNYVNGNRMVRESGMARAGSQNPIKFKEHEIERALE